MSTTSNDVVEVSAVPPIGHAEAMRLQAAELHLTGPAGGRFRAGAGGDRIDLDAVEFCRVLAGRGTGQGLLATVVPF